MVEKMSGDVGNSRASNALHKRHDSIKKWKQSDTAKQPDVRTESQFTIKFDAGTVFLSCVTSGDLEEAKRYLDKGFVDIDYTNVDGLTALHQACIDENIDMVTLLVERGANIEARDNEGWTPLHAAVSAGDIDIARYLLENDADLMAVNNEGEVPADLAEDEEMDEFLCEIIEERDLELDEARNEEEMMMLEDASRWLNNKKVEEVLDWQGATALHVAAAKDYKKVISLLLECGLDVNVRDNDNWSPLHAAIHWGSKNATELLTDAGADFEARNDAGQTPCDLAESDFVKTAESCKKRSRDNSKNPTKTKSDAEGVTPEREEYAIKLLQTLPKKRAITLRDDDGVKIPRETNDKRGKPAAMPSATDVNGEVPTEPSVRKDVPVEDNVKGKNKKKSPPSGSGSESGSDAEDGKKVKNQPEPTRNGGPSRPVVSEPSGPSRPVVAEPSGPARPVVPESTGPSRPSQRQGPDRPGPDRPGPDRPGPDRPGPDRSGPMRPGQLPASKTPTPSVSVNPLRPGPLKPNKFETPKTSGESKVEDKPTSLSAKLGPPRPGPSRDDESKSNRGNPRIASTSKEEDKSPTFPSGPSRPPKETAGPTRPPPSKFEDPPKPSRGVSGPQRPPPGGSDSSSLGPPRVPPGGSSGKTPSWRDRDLDRPTRSEEKKADHSIHPPTTAAEPKEEKDENPQVNPLQKRLTNLQKRMKEKDEETTTKKEQEHTEIPSARSTLKHYNPPLRPPTSRTAAAAAAAADKNPAPSKPSSVSDWRQKLLDRTRETNEDRNKKEPAKEDEVETPPSITPPTPPPEDDEPMSNSATEESADSEDVADAAQSAQSKRRGKKQHRPATGVIMMPDDDEEDKDDTEAPETKRHTSDNEPSSEPSSSLDPGKMSIAERLRKKNAELMNDDSSSKSSYSFDRPSYRASSEATGGGGGIRNREVREVKTQSQSSNQSSSSSESADVADLRHQLERALKEAQSYKQKYEEAVKEKEQAIKEKEQIEKKLEKSQHGEKELTVDRDRLKDENGALIRVISKLSRTPTSGTPTS